MAATLPAANYTASSSLYELLDTGSPNHFVEFEVQSGNGDPIIAPRIVDQDNRFWVDQSTNANRGNLTGNKTVATVGSPNFPGYVPMGITLAAGDIFGGEDDSFGNCYWYVRRGGSEIYRSGPWVLTGLAQTNFVGVKGPKTFKNLRYGQIDNPIAIQSTVYDAFLRKISIHAAYNNVSGVVPDFMEIQFGTGAWYPMTTVACYSDSTVDLEVIVPGSVSGYLSHNVRWHNATSVTRSFLMDIVKPFGGLMGGNDIKSAMVASLFPPVQVGLEGWQYIKAANYPTSGAYTAIGGVGPYSMTAAVPVNTTGTGAVKRDSKGGIGGNGLGITQYEIRCMVPILPYNTGNYEINWGPGIVITAVDPSKAGTYGFAHNSATGVTTFNTTGKTNVELTLNINVSSLGSGILYLPAPRLVGLDPAQKTNTFVPAVMKTISDGPRSLDGFGGYNNVGGSGRTITQMASSPPPTGGDVYPSLELEIDDANAMDAKFIFAFQTHVDSAEMVTYKANRFATRLNAGMKVHTGTGNENLWNTFSQSEDLRLEGLRQGLHLMANSSSPRQTFEIYQGNGLNGIPAMISRKDTAPAGWTTLVDIPLGRRFSTSVSGGYPVYEALTDVPAGTFVDYATLDINSNDNFTVWADNNISLLAGKRYLSELIRRNSDIWRQQFSAVGRGGLSCGLDGFAQDATFTNASLAWNDLRSHVDFLSIAPYYNGGQFNLNFMNYNDANFWDATSKAMETAGDLTGAIAYIMAKAIPLYRTRIASTLKTYKTSLYAANVAAGLAADAVKLHFYEYNDHAGFGGFPNWPSQARAQAFYNAWNASQSCYDFNTMYLETLASVGAPGFLYGVFGGSPPFGLFPGSNYGATDVSGGPGTNWKYKAVADMAVRVRALA